MIWQNYSHLEGRHSFLSASKHYWLNYTEEKLISVYRNQKRVALGTRYHNLAAELITLRQRLEHSPASFNSFVNDGISFRMKAEVVLWYSDKCFGTADAISYSDGVLRIHDLKTGMTPGSMNQLMVYAALFCLNYNEQPDSIVLQIYQDGEVVISEPSYGDVKEVMDKIVLFSELLSGLDDEENPN